jgi:hypothetical protein
VRPSRLGSFHAGCFIIREARETCVHLSSYTDAKSAQSRADLSRLDSREKINLRVMFVPHVI